jgi:hypothetical protein
VLRNERPPIPPDMPEDYSLLMTTWLASFTISNNTCNSFIRQIKICIPFVSAVLVRGQPWELML